VTIRTLDTAEADLFAAYRYLEGERPGVGARLLASYRAALENIERFPQMYSPVEDDLPDRELRNVIFERLKYRVVYEVRPSEVLIVAVLSTRLRPASWHDRITDITNEE
jgi:plasmid stabilization system protein ParE